MRLPRSLCLLDACTCAPCLLASLVRDPYQYTFLACFARLRDVHVCMLLVNAVGGLFLGKAGLWPSSPILALRVYNMPTVYTISRLCLHVADRVYRLRTAFSCARVNTIGGPFLVSAGFRPPSKIFTLCVYNMPTVSTISRLRLHVADSVYRLQGYRPPSRVIPPRTSPYLRDKGGDFVPCMARHMKCV